MSKTLWIFQAAFAALFLTAGLTKLFYAPDELVAMGMAYAETTPLFLLKFIGFAEILGALGLVLPAATRIAPQLTPIAAMALTLLMGLAAVTHALRGEFGAIGVNALIGGATAFIAWGRFYRLPIQGRRWQAQQGRVCEGC